MSWLNVIWRFNQEGLPAQEHDVVTVYARELLQLREDNARLKHDLRLADECKDHARKERDEARALYVNGHDLIRQRDEALRERDKARAHYAQAFRLIADIWDATGDAFDVVEPPALLWPDMIIHPSTERDEHCGEQSDANA